MASDCGYRPISARIGRVTGRGDCCFYLLVNLLDGVRLIACGVNLLVGLSGHIRVDLQFISKPSLIHVR